MKKTAVLLIIASVFAFTGCSGVKPAERSDENQAGTGESDGTLYFTVTYEYGRTQDCSTKYTLDFDIEDIGYSVPSRFNGYQMSEGKLYRFAGLELYDETNYPETVKTGYVMCRIPLKYDTQSNMFVADGQVEVI